MQNYIPGYINLKGVFVDDNQIGEHNFEVAAEHSQWLAGLQNTVLERVGVESRVKPAVVTRTVTYTDSEPVEIDNEG